VALVVGFLLLGGGDEDARGPAATALLAVARAAEAQPAPAGRYAYTRIQRRDVVTVAPDPTFSFVDRRVEERWVGPDGDARIVTTPQPPAFPSARDRALWREAGRPLADARRSDRTVDAAALARTLDPGLRPLDRLPTDPDALHDVLRAAAARGEVPANVRTFELVASLLGHAAASPELRAALFTVASRIEGIEFAGPARDPLGRRGEAVAIESDDSGRSIRHLIVYAPRRAQLLASVATMEGGPFSSRILLASGATATAHARP
jgi:hypothetical protein